MRTLSSGHRLCSSLTSDKKIVIGTQLGVLSIFDRSKGYADSVDRIPGHPHSVESMVRLPGGLGADVIATGSSDGLIRLVQIHPNKLLGPIADHGEFPVERIKIDRNGRWLGSASHDEVLKLTDLDGCLEDSDNEEMQEEEQEQKPDSIDASTDSSTESDSEPEPTKKRKRKKEDKTQDKRRKTESSSSNFFSQL